MRKIGQSAAAGVEWEMARGRQWTVAEDAAIRLATLKGRETVGLRVESGEVENDQWRIFRGLCVMGLLLLGGCALEPREQGYYTAAELCGPYVEAQADYNFRWMDSKSFRFYRSRPAPNYFDTRRGEVFIYIGDRIEMVNAFGTWIRHSYECHIDISDQTMVAGEPVRVFQGILEPLPQ